MSSLKKWTPGVPIAQWDMVLWKLFFCFEKYLSYALFWTFQGFSCGQKHKLCSLFCQNLQYNLCIFFEFSIIHTLSMENQGFWHRYFIVSPRAHQHGFYIKIFVRTLALRWIRCHVVECGGFWGRKAEATTTALISKNFSVFLKSNADTLPQNSDFSPPDCLVYWLGLWTAMREVPGSNPV